MISYKEAQEIFSNANLTLYDTNYRLLSTYQEYLCKANQHMNLTAITDSREIWHKHFLDSAMLLQKISFPLYASCIDVGTGAGFPGLVLAIFRPDLQITLLDSLQKRVTFLSEVTEILGLDHVRCIHARAEDAAKQAELRERFDFATARAVASLPIVLEYCLPFVKIGGLCIPMKGPNESITDGITAATALGAGIKQEICYTLKEVGTRKIFCYEKTNKTPVDYPRRGDKIQKKPLETRIP